ncbi:hypothetical protein MNB_SV-15-962 [hydrothermal vent metagenome]|uniref:Adenosine deaminase domain-containing protein n=1 Tax=hydrothermal vent metagenome TaxID=652676 RepID=A0A1W1EKK8_9ZZZZ
MPITKDKNYLSIISFLDSFKTIKDKIKSYFEYSDNINHNEILDLIKLDNEYNYDLNIEDSFDFLRDKLKFNFIEIYKYLGKMHYMLDNGKIYLSNEELENYQLLSSAIDINPLICSYILEYIDDLDDNNRYRFINNNKDIEFKFYGDIEERIKKYSDLHIHLGGAVTFDNRLHYLLQNINQDLSQEHQMLFKNIISCDVRVQDIIFSTAIIENILIDIYIISKNLNNRDFNLIKKYKFSEYYHSNNYREFFQENYRDKSNLEDIYEYIELNSDLDELLKLILDKENIYEYVYFQKYNHPQNSIRNYSNIDRNYYFGDSFSDYLLQNMFNSFQNNDIGVADRYLVLFFIDKLNNHDEYQNIIEIYFVFRNIIKQFIIQQHKRDGLGYFSLYSRSRVRRDDSNFEKKLVVKYIIHKSINTNIEGRITLDKNPHKIIEKMQRYIEPFEKYKKKEDNLKEFIHGLSKDIYRDINCSFTIDDLIDAWFLRRNSPNEIITVKGLFSSKIDDEKNNRTYKLKEILEDSKYHYFIPNFDYVRYALPDFISSSFNNNSYIHQRYRHIKNNKIAYKLFWLYQQDSDIIYEASKFYDRNFLFQNDFYETLQDVMMEHIIAKRGIIIESNLTSNILVGGLNKYSEHPIFRFKSIGDIKPNRFNIRTKKLKVVLGTDNPGIQNTSFIKELYHLKNACNENGFTDEEAYEYINDIIEEGNRAFN